MQIILENKTYTFYRIGKEEYLIHIMCTYKGNASFGGFDFYNTKLKKENNYIEFELNECLSSRDQIKTYADFSDFRSIFNKNKELRDM